MSIVINSDPSVVRRRRHQQVIAAFATLGFIAFVFGVTSGGLTAFSQGASTSTSKELPLSVVAAAGGSIMIIVASAFGMLMYLRPALADAVLSGLSTGTVGISYYPTGTTQDSLKSLTQQVIELQQRTFSDRTVDSKAIADLLRDSVQDSILEQLQTKYAEESVDAARLSEVRSDYISMENRLRLEIDSLGLRSNINLTIGVLTTLMAVTALAFMVFTSDRKFESMVDVFAHYVPRLALVVFIEIFSFFFLRLYRSTLEEIRLYQQKLNDAVTQKVAIELTWALNDSSAKSEFAKTLLTTQPRAEPGGLVNEDVDVNALAKVVGQLVKLLPTGSAGKQA